MPSGPFSQLPQLDLARRPDAAQYSAGGCDGCQAPAGRWTSAHDDAVGHMRRYSRPELASLVKKAGLTLSLPWPTGC
jgi:hypothetical protein